MKKLLLLLILAFFVTSCTVTESIIFKENGSGQFMATYEMGDAMKIFSNAMGGKDSDKKKSGKVMDTTMVFADIMEMYKDSVAALPENKRLAMEAVKDMFMTMRIDESKEEMNFGVGLNFNSIDDLKDIQEKIKKAQSLNAQNDQIEMMKSGSPLGKFMGDNDDKVTYSMTENSFSRLTTLPENYDETGVEALFDESNPEDKEFMTHFENAYYTVKLTFPRPIKSVSVKDTELSEDRKTVTYKKNWLDYIKNPLLLDVNIELVDE